MMLEATEDEAQASQIEAVIEALSMTEEEEVYEEEGSGEGGDVYDEEMASEEEEMKEYVTSDEVVEAMKGLADQLRDEMAASIKASQATVLEAIKEGMGPLADEISGLKKKDDEKIAEKAMDTPAASLRTMVERAIGSKQTKVKESDKLDGGPKQTAPNPTQGNSVAPSFIRDMMRNEDQTQ
jgi:hypothetical protein